MYDLSGQSFFWGAKEHASVIQCDVQFLVGTSVCVDFLLHQDLIPWSRTHCGGSWPPSPGPLIVSRPAIQGPKDM